MRLRRTVVTPGYNPKYLEILLGNLLERREEFDNWVIWANTNNPESLKYLQSLPAQHSFISIQYSEEPITGYPTLSHYWRKCIEESTLYLRLDEDIVYIHPGSLTLLFETRVKHPEPFLVFGNIVNNAIINHKYQEKGILKYPGGILTSDCFDNTSIRNVDFLHFIHNLFLQKQREGKLSDFFFDDFLLTDYRRFSINVFCVFGADLKQFLGHVQGEEEPFLSVEKPYQLKRPNLVAGKTLFSHFSFHTQRTGSEEEENLLQQYKNLLP